MLKQIAFGAWLTTAGLAGAPRFLSDPTVKPNPNASVPLAAVLTFSTDTPVRTTVGVSDGKNRWVLEYGPERDPARGLPVIGMRPARAHTIRVTVRDRGGAVTRAAKSLTFTTPALPSAAGEFPPLHVTRREPAQMEPGLTLFSPRRNRKGDPEFGARFGMLAMIDSAGEVVWYYRTDSRISDLEVLKNGHLAFLTQDYRMAEIDLLGNTVRQWYAVKRPRGPVAGAVPIDTAALHHELDELPNGNLVVLGAEVREVDDYYTSETDPRAPRRRQRVMGDEVIEITPAGQEVWRWRAFDALDPRRIGYETFSGYWDRRGFPGVIDWSHGNGLQHVEGDDSLLVNFRYQAAVIKLDRKTKEIRWIAGNHDNWPERLRGKLLTLAGADRWFYHQHAPHLTPRGTLLLFDNGNYQRMPFEAPAVPGETHSRAVEYAIDERTRTARQVWASEGTGPDNVVSAAMGDVQLLPRTGNVLVHYGALVARPLLRQVTWDEAVRNANTWSRIRELTHTTPARLVWEVELGDPTGRSAVTWVLFGGRRLAGIGPLRQ